MAGNIKGLTIEIGGDTTKLGKALEDVNKKSSSLSSELGQVNKLLKMDPGNTQLIAQKQKILAEAVENTCDKLKTLKEAEKQVQKQFEKGEVSEAQVRALQREIIAAEKKMDGYKKAAKEVKKGNDNIGKSADKAEKSSGGLGKALANAAKVGLAAVAAAAGAAIAGLIGCAESTREYRREMGKLDTAFTTSGHSSEAATQTYQALQGVLGETDQAVEAANHLAKLTDDEKDLQKWTDVCTGVYATFGASLPIEGLTEASNETAKVGQVTGVLADALTWAGVSEDAFNERLAACTTEQERQSLILETLNGLYSDAATAYRETNAEVIRANQANEAWTASLASVGASIEPILTDVKQLGTALVADLVPGVKTLANSTRALINGEGSADAIGEALSGIVTELLAKVTALAPTIGSVGISLITSLIMSLYSMLPQLATTGVQLLVTILQGLSSAVPQLYQAVAAMLPQLVQALVDGLPLLIEAGVGMIDSILRALSSSLPSILTTIAKAIPRIVTTLITALTKNIPVLITGAVTFLTAIIQAIPLMLQALVPEIPTIIESIITGLLGGIPLLIEGALQLLMAIIEAVPLIIVELIAAVPDIIMAIVKGIYNGLSQIGAAAKSIGERFMSFVRTIPGKVSSAFKQIPGKISEATRGAVEQVRAWGSGMVEKAREGMRNIVTTVSTTLKELPRKVLEVGRSLITGLWQGITDKFSWLTGKIKGFASNVMGKIKDFFGVKSPSKETAWVGEMLDRGLAKGVLENLSNPVDAMRKVSGRMLDAAAMDINGLTFDRRLQHTFIPAPQDAAEGLGGKLDRILEAIERGQVLTIDGTKLVGATVDKLDAKLGQRRALAARGAV